MQVSFEASWSGSLLHFLRWGRVLWEFPPSALQLLVPRSAADVPALLLAVQTQLASVEDPLVLLERVCDEHFAKVVHS